LQITRHFHILLWLFNLSSIRFSYNAVEYAKNVIELAIKNKKVDSITVPKEPLPVTLVLEDGAKITINGKLAVDIKKLLNEESDVTT